MDDKEIIFLQNKDLETPEALKLLEESDYVLCRQYHDKAILNILDPIILIPQKEKNQKEKIKGYT